MINVIFPAETLIWLIPLMIWDLVWKGIGLWKAGRHGQLVWFIAMLILNTAGILPILYLAFFQKKKRKVSTKKKKK